MRDGAGVLGGRALTLVRGLADHQREQRGQDSQGRVAAGVVNADSLSKEGSGLEAELRS